MAFTIRTRLTVWYVTLLTVTLITSGVAFFYYLYKVSIDRIDSQISSVANMMVHTVVKPSGQLFLPRDFDVILERFFGIRTTGNYIQVLDTRGEVVARSSNLDTFSLPISRDTYVAAVNGQTTFEVVRKVGRYPVRVVTRPIIMKDRGLVAIVQVGSSLEGLDEVFHSLFYVFVFGMLGSVVVASAVGWFMARKALKPVMEITKLARRIGAESLDKRIKIANPKDEIGRLASTINEMFERLEKSFRQIRQFTGDASHELKTPLTILKGEMEMALRAQDDREYVREVLQSSLEEIDRMNYIVRSLLELAKMDVEKGGPQREKVELDRVLLERYEQLKRHALDSGIQLDMLRIEPATVLGDRVRLSQLIFNLIDNAIKYTHGGGKVEISLALEDGSAAVRIKDTGIGIAADDLPYIFDRFYRVDKARSREVGGAGLGLAICKEIAVAHGGSLEVESRAGEGSTFIVKLPQAVAGEETPDTKGSRDEALNPI